MGFAVRRSEEDRSGPNRQPDVPVWVLDALFGTAVACAIALIIAADQGGQRRPDLIAYLFAAGFGALILLRRRFPRLMLIITVAGTFGYYILEYPPIGVAVPVVAALFATTDAGLLVWAIAGGVVVFGVSMFFRILQGEPIGLLIGYESVSNLALIVMAVALGMSTRTRRLRAAQQELINRLTAAESDARAQLQIRAEREHLSRDLHDTVGHTMSVITMQAGVVEESIGVDDRVAAEAVQRILEASRRTLVEIRSMVRLLRSDEDHPGVSLADLDQLFRPVRGAGIAVSTRIELDPADIPPPVAATGYRVVQEALTNVLRHSRATRAEVRLTVEHDHVVAVITDNGRGRVGDHAPGQGLIGMRERVTMLGGTVEAGDRQGGGFRVEARLPLTVAGRVGP